MSKKRKRDRELTACGAASTGECTGLMPTPAEEEAERLAYSEIETLQTAETLSRDMD